MSLLDHTLSVLCNPVISCQMSIFFYWKIAIQTDAYLTFPFHQSSLLRQEFLEHDQQIVALLSMVRHIEVRVKQQQQQSIGRSLIALDDIIKQTEVRDVVPANV